MGAWLGLLATGLEPPLWLDDTAYSGRLLAGGQIPWRDVTALIAWRLKAFELLRPSLAVLDVGEVVTAHAAVTPGLAADRRPIGPLTALLSTGELQQHVAAIIRGLRSSFREPLALVVPSPRCWPMLAYLTAFNKKPPIGADEVDEASVLMASFLRGFGDTGVDALLLTDNEGSAPATASELDWYQSVFNVAHHYRWDLGMKMPTVPVDWHATDFVIARSGAAGIEIDPTFWAVDIAPPAVEPGGFRYASIPEHVAPERALARLAVLRGT